MSKDDVMVSRDDGVVYHRWNISQYFKFKRERPEDDKKEVIQDHPLVGKQFQYQDKKVTFERITKQWYGGFYLVGLFHDEAGSSGTIVVENINSMTNHIKESAERFGQDFTMIDPVINENQWVDVLSHHGIDAPSSSF